MPEDLPELAVLGHTLEVRTLYSWAQALPLPAAGLSLREVLGVDDSGIARMTGIREVTVRRHALARCPGAQVWLTFLGKLFGQDPSVLVADDSAPCRLGEVEVAIRPVDQISGLMILESSTAMPKEKATLRTSFAANVSQPSAHALWRRVRAASAPSGGVSVRRKTNSSPPYLASRRSSGGCGQGIGHGHQEPVPFHVTLAVVKGFEPVHVHHDQG